MAIANSITKTRTLRTIAALFFCSAVLLAAHVTAQSAGAAPSLLLGAAWYPEQWPESRWDADLQLMEDAHLHVVRVGEFAWSTLEPSEGRFDLDWLARAIRLAEKHRIAVVIGTPTDAPPAWLTSAHPEVLRVDANGHRAEHGIRRQFNYASPAYRIFCAQIAEKLAQRFGRDPDVIGWQIGNEYTDESFDSDTRRQFDAWLQRKYGALDVLNHAWATAYWSQTYDRWDEIPLPLPGANENPGLLFAYKHFVTDTWRSFQQVQIDVIRRYADPHQFITTNLGGLGWSDNFDHYAITQPLDLASWDDYVGEGHLNAARNGAIHDYVRGWKRRNFWVMETQPGSVNWARVNTMLDRGETRAMAWQAVGHGADAVLYWQWRDALNGQEQYHGAIVGSDGNPLPIYDEVRAIGADFESAAAALENTTPQAQVALITTYDSRWAIDFQPHNRDYDQLEVLLDYYRPLRDERLTVDIVNANAPLANYKLVFAPSLNLISKDLAAHLLAYVRQGGHLILGPRSGMKDENDALHIERQPGPLVAALGGRVEQYYALDNTAPVSGTLGSGTASLWAEQLSTANNDGQVLLRYGKSNGWLDNQPAMITRSLGKGRITYLGAVLDPGLMKHVIDWATNNAQVKPEFASLPAGIELCRRVGEKRTVYILINHNIAGQNPAALHIALPAEMKDVLHSNQSVKTIDLGPQGVAVLQADAQ
ncbi:MAG TPA: beta-galactosidase [Terracidiphilus sp.]|nr:beta-galactosidase [Terracidiphilus sp.]